MRHDSNKYVKHFTCWNQLLAMRVGQLTNRESLRDLIVAIDAHSSKFYHLGFGKNVTRNNLSRLMKTETTKYLKSAPTILSVSIRESVQKLIPIFFQLNLKKFSNN